MLNRLKVWRSSRTSYDCHPLAIFGADRARSPYYKELFINAPSHNYHRNFNIMDQASQVLAEALESSYPAPDSSYRSPRKLW